MGARMRGSGPRVTRRPRRENESMSTRVEVRRTRLPRPSAGFGSSSSSSRWLWGALALAAAPRGKLPFLSYSVGAGRFDGRLSPGRLPDAISMIFATFEFAIQPHGDVR
jgi:hypothetical protein